MEDWWTGGGKTAGVAFDTRPILQQVQSESDLHAEVVGQAAAEIVAKDQAHTGLAAADRFAVPGLREGSARSRSSADKKDWQT